MTLRTDKVSGAITCAFGVVMICFASFGLIVAALQRAMVSTMQQPMPRLPNELSVIDAMNAVHGVFFVYLPLMLVGGIVYAVSGFYVRRGSLSARRVAQVNAVVGYVWAVAYSISCSRAMDVLSAPAHLLPEPAFTAFRWFFVIIWTLIIAAFPTGVLYLLSRPRSQAAGEPTGPAESAP